LRKPQRVKALSAILLIALTALMALGGDNLCPASSA